MKTDLLGEDRLAGARRTSNHGDRTLRHSALNERVEVSHSGFDARDVRAFLGHDSVSSASAGPAGSALNSSTALAAASDTTFESAACSEGERISAVRLPRTVRNSTITKATPSVS